MDWFVIGVCVAVGLAIAGLWSSMLARRQVPELAQGLASIRFHITAEYLASIGLLIGGVGILIGATWGTVVAAASLGAALYSTINSPGYYADRGQRQVVYVFIGLALVIAAAVAMLITLP